MALTENSVIRHIDASGSEIKAYLDDDGTFIQVVAVVDEKGTNIWNCYGQTTQTKTPQKGR